jgi:head-tail adaptor
MSAPEIGALRRRFSVEAPVIGADGMLAYSAAFAAWAVIETSREATTIRLRARSEIEPGWRLRLGARVFEITTRLRDESASGYMVCICREISP